jgi:sigma-B regulation protein RsbU (phosphoserine phosphatase)
LRTDGRIVKANRTFCSWTGYALDDLIGKRLHDFLNIAGRIFYETHFAPLLRMQGFFNEVALDFVTKDSESSFQCLSTPQNERMPTGHLCSSG